MNNFLEFLNSQSGTRLEGYSIVFLLALSIVVMGIVEIFKVFKRKNKL
jgi:hypothetical protein